MDLNEFLMDHHAVNGKILCPLHDDHNPSVSVSERDGMILVHCFVCGTDRQAELAAALGLAGEGSPAPVSWAWGDRGIGAGFVPRGYDKPPGAPRVDVPSAVRWHQYSKSEWKAMTSDASGGKRAVWLHNAGQGWQQRQHPTVPRIPYGIQSWSKAGKYIMIVAEGEKDADTMADYLSHVGDERPFAVTTLRNGAAGSPADFIELLSCFRSRITRVHVIGDNDDAGRRHVQSGIDAFKSIGVKVDGWLPATPEPKSDLTDHLSAGLALDDLIPFRSGPDGPEAPERNGAPAKFTATRASDITMTHQEWVWKDEYGPYLPDGQIAVFCGRESQGKTTVVLGLGAKLTTGTLPGKYWGQPQNICYVAVEDSWSSVTIPRLRAAGADLDRVFRLENPDNAAGRFLLPDDLVHLRQFITDYQVKLLVIDPFTTVLATDKQNDQVAIRRCVEPLFNVADETKTLIACVMHVNKDKEGDMASRINGSAAFKDAARAIISVASDRKTGEAVITPEKTSYGMLSPSRTFEIESHSFYLPGDDVPYETSRAIIGGPTDRTAREVLDEWVSGQSARESKEDAAKAWLVEYLTEHGAEHSTDIRAAAESAGHKKTTLYSAFEALESEGLAARDVAARGYWSLTAPHSVPEISGPEDRNGMESIDGEAA